MKKIAALALLLSLAACEEPLEDKFLALGDKFNPGGGEVTHAIMSCAYGRALGAIGREQLESYVILMEAQERATSSATKDVRLILQVRRILQNCAAEILAQELQAQ